MSDKSILLTGLLQRKSPLSRAQVFLKRQLGFPIAVSAVKAEQCANESEDDGANRAAAEGNRIHAMIGVDAVIEVDPVQEEDPGGKQESKG